MNGKAGVKFNGCGTHRRAILHMIGQSADVFKSYPSTAEIAAWMNVSKPTAKRYLDKMVSNGELIMSEVKYRKNAVKHHWCLTQSVYQDYQELRLKFDYKVYAQKVMKVILQDE